MEAKTAVTLALIKGAVAESSWRRCWQQRSHGETACWKSRLFYDVFWEGSLFKGSASSCMALLPLWLQYAQELFSEEPALAAEMASLEALARCGSARARLRRAPEGVAALVAELEAAQAQHQAAFCIAYPGKSRPKHQFRFHLPSQLRQLGAYVGAFPWKPATEGISLAFIRTSRNCSRSGLASCRCSCWEDSWQKRSPTRAL